MTDKWFLQDIEQQLSHRKKMVIIDPKGQCEFLLPILDKKGYKILKTDSILNEQWQTVQEELFLRCDAESLYKEKQIIFYVKREQSKLSFLFDYCFTHGCLDLSNPTEWLKKKLFANTGLQVHQDSKRLLMYAKIGIGKDVNWWKKVIPEIEKPIQIDEELLPFLNDPDTYLQSLDTEIREYTESLIFGILGQPYMSKPPKTLANEVVKLLFDSLLANSVNEDLLKLYYKWVDSDTYSTSLPEYISKYKIDKTANIWAAHPDHCFIKLDNEALTQITANLRDKTYVAEKLAKIKVRVKSQKVKKFVPEWWHDIITLLEFDSKPLSSCNSFEKIIAFYTSSFSKVDRAIRNLYASFLQDEAIIRPLQEYYENLNHELLQQWFEYANSYKTDQQGYLINLIKNSQSSIAIIVGDGLRYEIADFVASSIEKYCKVDKQIMLADIPSETEHDMSALYVGNNEVLPIHKDREKKLSAATGKEITFLDLEAVTQGINAEYLVLTYKDIDNTGEKLQHGAIKLFGDFEKMISDKIKLLLNMNYNEVYLITDHGFVLTGLLDESDKIEPIATGKKEVHERFIRTIDKQTNTDWMSFEKPYGEFKYVNIPKSHRPFKTRGKYGYSHGGFTPQEIIIPKFIFRKEKNVTDGLEIGIINKKELTDVTGENFGIKLQAASSSSDLFKNSRKVQVILYNGNAPYTMSSIITIDAGSTTSFEFSFAGFDEVYAVILDATTQEQLDSATIKKSNSRDLGGLL